VLTVGDVAASISVTHSLTQARLVFLNTSDIERGRILHKNYTEVATWPGQAKKSIRKGDILFSEIRPANGRYAFVDFEADDYVVSTKLMVIRPKPGKVLPRFLYHFLTSRKITDWLQHLAESRSGTFPQITFDQVAELELTNLSDREQQAIVQLLDALDEKLEQNRRTARALERLGRAIFKSWFVDFDPVKAKTEGASSFPSMPQAVFDALPTCFSGSENGPMPEGWKLKTIGELAIRISMGPFGSDIKTDNFVSDGVPVIRGGNLTDGFVDEGFVYLTAAKADQLASANAFPGDIVITHRGTLGQVGLIPAKSRHPRYVVSQSQMLVRPADELPSHFLYLFLTSPIGQYELLANRSQTGVPAISRPTTSVKAIRVIVPEKSLSLNFESIVSTLFDSRAAIAVESRKLTELRDYLLPRLLNGAVRIEDTNG